MKRLIVLTMVISCAALVLAQDIISLKSGEQIENITVLSITDQVIIYLSEGNEVSIPRNSADAVLYVDGRYEQIKPTLVGDSASIASVEQLGYDANELQQMISNGEDRKMLLWQDKSYPKECRKAGKKVYYKVFNDLYKPALKEAKESGLNHMETMQQAMQKTFMAAMKASNEAVRECNGGM